MLYRLLAFLWILHTAATAQTSIPADISFSGIIDSVFVSGNLTTKTYIILDEMTLRPGSVVTPQAVEYDRNRIYSLGLFNRVDMTLDTLQGLRILFVDVSERWYLIPVPIFGFRDGDVKRPFYGGGVLHNNVGGRNQKIFGSIVFGHNPSLSLFFSNPQISREHALYFSSSVAYSRIRNKSEVAAQTSGDFDENHFDIDATIGKRFSLYESGGFRLGYQIVEIDQYQPGLTVSPTGKDAYLAGTLNYVYDSRDLKEYASSGRFTSLSVTKYGFGTSDVNFARFGADIRGYIPLSEFVSLAGRAHGSIVSGGFIPTYSHAFFGYGERIRGNFRKVYEGENLLGTSVELRIPIMRPRTIHFRLMSLPPEFSFWRIGVSFAFFADAGATWYRGDKLTFNSFASGYGGGFHFQLPYSLAVRTEFALNEYGKGQFIFDVRTSF